MKSGSIRLHIDELVLEGIAPGERDRIADALKRELSTLLAERGVPSAWQSSPDRLETDPLRPNPESRPAITGQQIARAIHRGGTP